MSQSNHGDGRGSPKRFTSGGGAMTHNGQPASPSPSHGAQGWESEETLLSPRVSKEPEDR